MNAASRRSSSESRSRLCTRKSLMRRSAMRKSSVPVFGSGKIMSTSSAPSSTWRLVTSQSSRLTSMRKPEPALLSVTTCGVASISTVQSRPLSGFVSMERTTNRPAITSTERSAAPMPRARTARFIKFTRAGFGRASTASRAARSAPSASERGRSEPTLKAAPAKGFASFVACWDFRSGCAGGGPPAPSFSAPQERHATALPASARAVRYSRPQLWQREVIWHPPQACSATPTLHRVWRLPRAL